jgi:hypothetical protein
MDNELRDFRIASRFTNKDNLEKLPSGFVYVVQDMDGYWKVFANPPRRYENVWLRNEHAKEHAEAALCLLAWSQVTQVALEARVLYMQFNPPH